MADVRVRTVVGSTRSACPLCHSEDDHLILESKDRKRFPLPFAHADLHVKRYMLCKSCGSRTELALEPPSGADDETLDLS